MRFATCPLTKSAFGSPTHLAFELRLEKTQNLVSTNVPDVIESLRASCNGIGMVIARVTTSIVRELFAAWVKVCGTRGSGEADYLEHLRVFRVHWRPFIHSRNP